MLEDVTTLDGGSLESIMGKVLLSRNIPPGTVLSKLRASLSLRCATNNRFAQ